jgi:hypothetical protein
VRQSVTAAARKFRSRVDGGREAESYDGIRNSSRRRYVHGAAMIPFTRWSGCAVGPAVQLSAGSTSSATVSNSIKPPTTTSALSRKRQERTVSCPTATLVPIRYNARSYDMVPSGASLGSVSGRQVVAFAAKPRAAGVLDQATGLDSADLILRTGNPSPRRHPLRMGGEPAPRSRRTSATLRTQPTARAVAPAPARPSPDVSPDGPNNPASTHARTTTDTGSHGEHPPGRRSERRVRHDRHAGAELAADHQAAHDRPGRHRHARRRGRTTRPAGQRLPLRPR